MNFQKCQAVSRYSLIDKQMLEKVFCSNIAPSLSSIQEPHILQGRIHGTELPELGFGHNFRLGCTSNLKAFLNCILRALFRDTPLAHLSCHLAQSIWHLAHHQNLASGVCLKRAFKMQFRNAYFRSLVHSSRKLWPKPD